MTIYSEIRKDAHDLEDDVKAVNKVAQITLAFWIMKIAATTVGETAGDLFSMMMKIGYAASSIMLLAFFFVTLGAQLKSKTFHPFLYWGVILATSTAGTTISDLMTRTLGLGYASGAAILISILISILVYWRMSVGSLAVNYIKQPKVEMLYWMAILVSNTLGTAVGDFLADSSGLGYGMSNLLIAGVIALIASAHFFTTISRTVLFWGAFILTRPFGATMGDLLTKSHEKGGLGFGTVGSSAVLMGILLVFVFANYVNLKRKPAFKLQPAE